MDYSWYKKLTEECDDLEQGDFILKCPIIKPPLSVDGYDEVELIMEEIDSIILSQSCDLENNNIEIVLVCPFYNLKRFLEKLPIDQQGKKAKEKTIQNLKKGFFPGYHLLDKFERGDFMVVDFRNVYGVHLQTIRGIVATQNPRVRLLSPYKEHLSQAFARYFMRVGLPSNIDFTGYL